MGSWRAGSAPTTHKESRFQAFRPDARVRTVDEVGNAIPKEDHMTRVHVHFADGSAGFVATEVGDATIAPGIPPRDLTVTCLIETPEGAFTPTGALVLHGA